MKRKGGDFITKKTDYQSVFITEQWNEEQIMLKEMIFDFRKNKNVVPSLYIKGEKVEVTETYRYLGLTIDNKFTWNSHLDSFSKKQTSVSIF